MAIHAMKAPEWEKEVFDTLSKGEGRFGWSYVQTADLNSLKQQVEQSGWGSLSPEERDCYQAFLLDLKADDYVVYINVPEYGQCTLARVTGKYKWHYHDDDFNHRFPVDPASVRQFDRNDEVVPPYLRARLKLPGRKWRINAETDFNSLLSNLSSGYKPKPYSKESNLKHLNSAIRPYLSEITKGIHKSHPNFDLESPVAEVLRKIPGVLDVKPQGRSGSAGDHGADIIVTFRSGLPIPGLDQEGTLIVQVKSYADEHWDTQAVDDIRRAFKHYPEANAGLIVSTADSQSPLLEEELDKLREESGKPVVLLIGYEVAAFFLRFGANLLV